MKKVYIETPIGDIIDKLTILEIKKKKIFKKKHLYQINKEYTSLSNTLKKNITLGLDIGNENVLYEFTKVTKSRNLIYSLGIDFLKNFFSPVKFSKFFF